MKFACNRCKIAGKSETFPSIFALKIARARDSYYPIMNNTQRDTRAPSGYCDRPSRIRQGFKTGGKTSPATGQRSTAEQET